MIRLPEPVGGRLGVIVEDLPDRLKSSWKLRGGVVLRELDRDGAAAQAGLVRGDVIIQIGNASIQDSEGFAETVAGLPANTHVPVRFVRQGRSGFVAIRIEERD